MFFQHGSPLKKLDVSPHFLIHGTGKMNPGGFNLDSVVLLGILEGSFQYKDREDKKNSGKHQKKLWKITMFKWINHLYMENHYV